MTALNESNNFRDVVRMELSDIARFCRAVVTVLSGQVLTLGTVLGKILFSTPTSGTADAGNSGAATVTSVVAKSKLKKGVYTIKCLSFVASPLLLNCRVTDPDGNVLPSISAFGAYVSDQINFTLANGSPAIVAGDKWTITVADGSGKVKGIDFDAVDGSQKAYGILISDVDASSGDVDGVAVVRDALIIADNLVYPTTSPAVTDDQKALALADLAAVNIIERDEA